MGSCSILPSAITRKECSNRLPISHPTDQPRRHPEAHHRDGPRRSGLGDLPRRSSERLPDLQHSDRMESHMGGDGRSPPAGTTGIPWRAVPLASVRLAAAGPRSVAPATAFSFAFRGPRL